MGFFKNFYNDIDASNPTERIHTFIWGLFGISLMMFAIADLIGGGIYILCILIGVIRLKQKLKKSLSKIVLSLLTNL